MHTTSQIISLDDLKKFNCSDSLHIINKDFDLFHEHEGIDFIETPSNILQGKIIYNNTFKFMSYEKFDTLSCIDNKHIINDNVDINPTIPPLGSRPAISLSSIIRKNKKDTKEKKLKKDRIN